MPWAGLRIKNGRIRGLVSHSASIFLGGPVGHEILEVDSSSAMMNTHPLITQMRRPTTFTRDGQADFSAST